MDFFSSADVIGGLKLGNLVQTWIMFILMA